jgi:hypothetical protein
MYSEYPDDIIRPVAFVISQEKDRQGIRHTPDGDWQDAIKRLETQESERMNIIHRGEVGY